MKKVIASIAVAASLGLLSAGSAFAEYPERTVTLIVPYNPGGATDLQARLLMPYVEKYLGQTIIIENRGGAGTIIGATAVANAQPDGYTLGKLVFPTSYGPIITGDATYGLDSFTPLVNQWVGRNCICVSADSEFEELSDFIAAAEGANVNVGVVSLSSAAYYASRILQDEVGYNATHVPFDGGAAVATALLGGHIPVASLPAAEALEQYRAGALRALAVLSDSRWDAMPDVPTSVELGYEATFDSLGGYVAPAGLPDDVREKLVAAFEAALADEDYLRIAQERSLQLLPMDNAEFGPSIEELFERLTSVVEADLASQ